MSNSLTAFNESHMSARAGMKQYKSVVYRAIGSFREESILKKGDEVDRPYRTDLVAERYAKGVVTTDQDVTSVSDKLTITDFYSITIYIDDIDKIQNKYNSEKLWGTEIGKRLAIQIDAFFLYETLNAADSIDDGDIGGTAGDGITVGATNIIDVVAAVNRKLEVLNITEDGDKFLVISPQFKEHLWKYLEGKDTPLGDKVGVNGFIGRYAGLKIYLSNNLTGSARWTPVNNPTTGATITIESIVCEFVDSLTGGTADANPEFHICSTLALTFTNMVTAIAAPSTAITEDTNTGYQIPTKASIRAMEAWVAVNGTTYLEVRVKGASYLTVATSESADVWTTEQQKQHLLAGKKGCIDVVVQKAPSIKQQDTLSNNLFGKKIGALTLFGTKVFDLGTRQMLDVQVRSDSY